MADVVVLVDAAGPLPLSINFDAPGDGPVTFVLTGTAWTQNAPCLTGIQLMLDGETLSRTAICFANENANHQALRPAFIPIENLSYGSHTLEIVPYNQQTVTDLNDYFQVVLYY